MVFRALATFEFASEGPMIFQSPTKNYSPNMVDFRMIKKLKKPWQQVQNSSSKQIRAVRDHPPHATKTPPNTDEPF